MIDVLISDKSALFCQCLSVALGQNSDMAILELCPKTGPEALDLAVSKNPGVSLLDYWMIGMGGPAATCFIRRRSPNTKVVLLSWFYGTVELHNALAAGAHGFLPRSVGVQDVAGAIRRVDAGETRVMPQELKSMVDDSRVEAESRVWETVSSITPKELLILRALGAGLSPSTIASKSGSSVATVRTQINRILRKLGVRSQMEAVGIARHYEVIPP